MKLHSKSPTWNMSISSGVIPSGVDRAFCISSTIAVSARDLKMTGDSCVFPTYAFNVEWLPLLHEKTRKSVGH